MNRPEVPEIRIRLEEIYKFQVRPPECLVAQMAFTSLNSFLLTTDGRVFSWGALHYCLGRELNHMEQNALGASAANKLNG